MRYKISLLAVLLLCLFVSVYTTSTSTAQSPDTAQSPAGPESAVNWAMAAANPQRTSWTPQEVSGSPKPIWYRTFEPYISQKVQIIAADNTLYIATARGLYALNATTGGDKWVFPTELPLGHSPTVIDNVVYVGGMDRRMYALNAQTGQELWSFTAGAGWHTNPLVVNGVLYAGNRDGYFYAVSTTGSTAGQMLWRYQTGGPILYSAAYADGVVFFASNDSYAYALSASTGDLVWRSEKLPGQGFYSWWPVVWENRVIFSGSNNYRVSARPGPGSKLTRYELEEIYPNYDAPPDNELVGPIGNVPGDWAPGTVTVDASAIMNYFAAKPWRKTVFVLDRATGAMAETAPLLWTGTHSGNRYPPVIGSDGVLYQQANYMADPAIAGGQMAGWQPGVPYLSVISSDWAAVDEPHAGSAGGNYVYWLQCCNRGAGGMDITLPNTTFQARVNQGFNPPTGAFDGGREILLFGGGLENLVPGFDDMQNVFSGGGLNSFGLNGVYGIHGDVNPLVPYNGRLYVHRGNSIIAFGDYDGQPTRLPTVQTVHTGRAGQEPDPAVLQSELETQIQKILDAGHLYPGYMSHGIFDLRAQSECGDNIVDYWSHPSETLYTLLAALPHLPAGMQTQVRAYVQNEYNDYPPFLVNHIGWDQGAPRSDFILPPEVEADRLNLPYSAKNINFSAWNRNPFTYYALWQYAKEFGSAAAIYNVSKGYLPQPPADAVLLKMPYAHNAFLSGYIGFLELEKLAGQPESTNIRNELNRLLALRKATFTANSPIAGEPNYCRTLNVAGNFMYMTPQLAAFMRTNLLSKVGAAVNEYETIAPYWFAGFATEGLAENAIVPLHDSHALFMAKSLILDTRGAELYQYLDVAQYPRGDLYHIQKLVVMLQHMGESPLQQQHYLPGVSR